MEIVYLEWYDSAALEGWTDKSTMKKFIKQEAELVKTIGWLVGENKSTVTVCAHWNPTKGESPHHSPMSIPKVAIKTREMVKR